MPNGNATFGGLKATLDFDQMNRMYFATDGWAAKISYFDSPQAEYSRLDAEVRGAFSMRDTVISSRLAYSGSPRGELPIYDAATLGGFLNMTAYAKGQIIGDEMSYAGVRAEQIIGRLPLGLRGDMRLGVALEVARAGYRYTETQSDALLNSISLYLGGETPFGPVYLGGGYSTTGVSNLFLFVGVP